MNLVAPLPQLVADHGCHLAAVGDVDLVQRHQPRPINNAGSKASSSASITSRSPTGSRSVSNVAVSTTCTSALQRCTCRRNSCPRPCPDWPGDQAGHVRDGERSARQ